MEQESDVQNLDVQLQHKEDITHVSNMAVEGDVQHHNVLQVLRMDQNTV
jgi:hypothetical protein